MKSAVGKLGVLLLFILLAVSIISLILLFTNSINELFVIALGVILLLVFITVISFLLLDLYQAEPVELEENYTKEI